MKKNGVHNIMCVGIGGQGVLTVSEILSQAAFEEGYDVKKSEVHGMAQRGGSVTSSIRYGEKVYAPLIPAGEIDLLLGFELNEAARSRHLLRIGGNMVQSTKDLEERCRALPRTLNVAILGLASQYLPFSEESWETAIRACVPPNTTEINLEAFQIGRQEIAT